MERGARVALGVNESVVGVTRNRCSLYSGDGLDTLVKGLVSAATTAELTLCR